MLGLGLLLKAAVPKVASGTWSSAGEFGVIPSGAAAEVVRYGRLRVSGGASGGLLSDQIAIYDPATSTWVRAGRMSQARSGHATAILSDGRVFISGGITANGVSASIEIYDPAAGVSTATGAMGMARTDHAVATLKDGRVLVVGGSNGHTALALAELADPNSGTIVPVSSGMSVGRAKLSATTLLDGHVFIAGGNDGSKDLASAEIFNPAAQTFSPSGTVLSVARSGHIAILLPHNNSVLIAGGSISGTTLSAADLYAPWTDRVSVTNSMSAARSGAVGGGLDQYEVALVGGGGATTAEYYGYATVKTDHHDYAPGQTVTITGSGWQPGETVTLTLREDPPIDTHGPLTAVADPAGNFVNAQFVPDAHDIGIRFYLTAAGAGSQAQTTFTDAKATTTSIAAPTITYGANGTVTVTVSVNAGPPPTGNVTLSIDGGTAVSKALSSFSGSIGSTTFTNTDIPALTRPTHTGSPHSLSASYAPDGNNFQASSATGSLVVNAATLTIVGTPAYDGTTTASASILSVSNKVGTDDVTVATGSGTLASKTVGSPAITSVGPLGLGGTAAGNYTLTGATGSGTINKAHLTVTADNQSKTYDGTVFSPFTATISGFKNGETPATSGMTGAPGFTGAATTATAAGTYTITPTLSTLNGGTNYDFPAGNFVNGTLIINPRNATWTTNPASKTYGDTDPSPLTTGSGTNFVAADGVSASYSRAPGETVAGGLYHITATLSATVVNALANYTITNAGADFTITKRTATWTTNPASKTYGDTDPSPLTTGSGTNFVAADGVSASYSRAAGETVAGGLYHIPATLSATVINALANYTITNAR